MIHNGIEYGMMQALAEGLHLLKGKQEFNFDLAQLTELWRHSSVVRSWLLDLTAGALQGDQELANVAPYVSDSGEGRWTVIDSVEQGLLRRCSRWPCRCASPARMTGDTTIACSR